jgi:DNA mismatch endonuclease (patch repair protein)
MMRSIRKTNTGPERTVRRLLRELGHRYKLYARDLPGSPDIVFRGKRAAIFVHGCFWHQHEGCPLAKRPSARPEYWLPKLARNKARDRKVLTSLQAQGWRVLTLWECQLGREATVKSRLKKFLRNTIE